MNKILTLFTCILSCFPTLINRHVIAADAIDCDRGPRLVIMAVTGQDSNADIEMVDASTPVAENNLQDLIVATVCIHNTHLEIAEIIKSYHSIGKFSSLQHVGDLLAKLKKDIVDSTGKNFHHIALHVLGIDQFNFLALPIQKAHGDTLTHLSLYGAFISVLDDDQNDAKQFAQAKKNEKTN